MRPLGRGGMATVYLAEDERLGRQVAIKRLHADSPEDMERRFAREAKVGASLNHPNLVWVFDTVTDDEGVLIVMEYVDGPTLARELSGEPLRPRRAVEVIAAVAAALEHAHEEGIVHRDVKPANVLLGRGGVIKLADLGIARSPPPSTRASPRAAWCSAPPPTWRPSSWRASGSRRPPTSTRWPPWPSRRSPAARRAAGRTPMEVAHAITAKPPPDLREAWQDAPAEAAEVLRRGMARDPAERPASACDLASDLAAALGEETTARHRLDAARAATGGAAARAPRPRGRDTAEASAHRRARAGARPARRPPRARAAAAATPAPRPALRAAASTPRPGDGGAAAALAARCWPRSRRCRGRGRARAGGGRRWRSRRRARRPPAERIAQSDARHGAAERRQRSGAAPAAARRGVPEPANKGGAAEGARLNRQGFRPAQPGQVRARPSRCSTRSVEAFPPGTTDVQYAFALFNLGKALRLSGKPADAVPVLERRLQIPNQTSTVQKELDAARRDAE